MLSGERMTREMRVKQAQKGHILYACPEEGIVVLRVVGRGDFEISPQVKTVCDKFNREDYSPAYILDLEHCPAMDSTFMGVVAAIALHQIACRDSRMVVLNAEATAQMQLDKLGLKYILEMRRDDAPGVASVDALDFEESPAVAQSRFDRIIHMIESHEALIDVDSGNEVKFKGVLQSLSESLDRERHSHEGHDGATRDKDD